MTQQYLSKYPSKYHCGISTVWGLIALTLVSACSSAPKLDDLAQRQLAQAIEYQEIGEDVRVDGSIFNPLESSLPSVKSELIVNARDITITRGKPRFKIVSNTRFGASGLLETFKTVFAYLPLRITWTPEGQPRQQLHALLMSHTDDVPLDAEEIPSALSEKLASEFFVELGRDIQQLDSLKEADQKVKILIPLWKNLEFQPVRN